MDIDRVGSVLEIPGCAVRTKEIRTIEFETSPHTRFKLHSADIATDGSQRAQSVSDMEVVNPATRWRRTSCILGWASRVGQCPCHASARENCNPNTNKARLATEGRPVA